MHIQQRFENAIEELYKLNYYLAGEVTKLGYPKYSESVPTAGVAWDEKRKKVSFLFNKEWAKTVTDEKFKSVVAHEAMHVLNMHIFLFCEKVKEMKRKEKTNSEISRFIRKLNVAADLVVNDTLTNLYGLDRIKTWGVIKGEPVLALYGKDVVKTDTEDMTAMEVYYLLPESKEGEGGDIHITWKSFLDADGNIRGEFIDAFGNLIKGNIENSMLSDEELGMLERVRQQMKDSTDSRLSKAGNDASSTIRPINNLDSNSLNWNKILFQFVETKKVVDIWTRPNRKLMAVYPDIILPSQSHEEREEIFIAIDVSGSIDREAFKLFMSVVKNVPFRFKVSAITFDTQCREFDVKGGKDPAGGGGTEFGIIEKYINDELKRYPKAIFVLTDGDNWDGKFEPNHPERWCWLLYGSNTKENISHMKSHEILKVLN